MPNIKIEEVAVEVVTADLDKVNVASGIGDESAIVLRGQFGTFYNDIVSWRKQAEAITDPENPEQQAIARTVRLGLRRVRCDVETVRKSLKAESLSRGKAIDGYANVLKHLTEPIEAQLLDVEQHAERQEAARIAAIVTDRTSQLVDAEADPTAYNLGAMDDETWGLVLAGACKKRDDRVEGERVAEADKVKAQNAIRVENERMQIENDKLILENKKRDAVIRADREKAKAREKAIEDLKREASEKEEKAERKIVAAKEEANNKIKIERDRRLKIETAAVDAKAKADASTKLKAAAAAAAARAPDRDKIASMAVKMRGATLPAMATDEGKAAMVKIEAQIEKFAAWIDGLAKGL